MKRYYFLYIIVIASASLFHCHSENEAIELRLLEVQRKLDFQKHRHLYKKYPILFLDSIAKSRDKRFISFIDSVLQTGPEEQIYKKCIFTLGQIHSDSSAALLRSLIIKKTGNDSTNLNLCVNALSFFSDSLNFEFLYSMALIKNQETDLFFNAMARQIKYNSANQTKIKLADLIIFNDQHTSSIKFHYFLSAVKKSEFLEFYINVFNMNKDSVFLLRLLSQLSEKDPDFNRKLEKISISDRNEFNVNILNLLKAGSPLQQFYALSIINPSSLVNENNLIFSLFNSSSPFNRIKAFKVVSEHNYDVCRPFLLNQMNVEENWFEKGQILSILSIHEPLLFLEYAGNMKAQGTAYFRVHLFESLLNISQGELENLDSYLDTKNSYMAISAINFFEKYKMLNTELAHSYLSHNSPAVVFTILEWMGKNDLHPSLSELKYLFIKFNQADQFELQQLILKTLARGSDSVSDSTLSGFYENISSLPMRTEFKNLFPDFIGSVTNYNLDFSTSENFLQNLIRPLSDDSLNWIILTNKGQIKIHLFPEYAPLTANNFIHLVNSQFYNGLFFHRVVPDFVIQGGDPAGDGWGGPGYMIPSEDNALPFKRGSVGIATSGFDTGGSQFFICHSRQPHLDGNYTLFANVIDGIEVIDLITQGDYIETIQLDKH